jgi:hypothetical protein
MSTWEIEVSSYYGRKLAKYQKKHPNEVFACLNNLDTYKQALDSGASPRLIKAGFIHPEPKGAVAIDQSGAPGSSRETRLYIYAFEVARVVHLITIGDKNTQADDIKDVKRYVDAVRKEQKENTNG